jgi:hypothetical protein
MKRYIFDQVLKDLKKKMVFITGPRQVARKLCLARKPKKIKIKTPLVKPFESGDKILRKIPGARKHAKQTVELVMEKKSNRQALRKMWGKWPGDESIEELLALLDGAA